MRGRTQDGSWKSIWTGQSVHPRFTSKGNRFVGFAGVESLLGLGANGKQEASPLVRLVELVPHARVVDGFDLPRELDVMAARFSPAGRWLAVPNHRATGNEPVGAIHLFDLSPAAASSHPVKLRAHQQKVTQLAFTPDARFLLSVDGSGRICRWPLRLQELLQMSKQTAGR